MQMDGWLQYLGIVVEVTLALQARRYHQLQRRFLVRVYTTVKTLSRRTYSTIPIRFIVLQTNNSLRKEGKKGKAQCSAAPCSASNCLLCCEALRFAAGAGLGVPGPSPSIQPRSIFSTIRRHRARRPPQDYPPQSSRTQIPSPLIKLR